MTTNYGWLKDQSRHDEVIEWLGGRWDINQLEQWSQGRFGLDELKTWIDGKYSFDEVVAWTYHPSDQTAADVAMVINEIRPGIEAHRGSIAFVGIDPQGQAHIAFDGACGSCSVRETVTLEQLKDFLTENVEGIHGVINDGPVLAATGNFSVETFTGEAPVQVRTLGRDIPTS